MIVDSIDDALKTLKRYRSGEISELTAIAVVP